MLRPATSASVIAAAMASFGAATDFAANPAPRLVGSASSSSGWINLFGWLFLALLLAVLFLLIGIAVGRRRTARSAA